MRRGPGRILTLVLSISALASVIGSASAAPLPQIAVLTTPAGEFQPARTDNALAWEQNTRRKPNRYDVLVRPDGGAAARANRPGTSAAMGDFAGDRLVYQQYRRSPYSRRGRSDLFFYDVGSGARTKVQGVNSRQWEYWPSHSEGWLLFGRWKPKNERRRLFLHNVDSGERRLLDRTKGRKKFIGPGQVNGNFAVWSVCRPRCEIVRYDIAAHTATVLDNPGFYQRAPSVSPGGTVYFSRGGKACGVSVNLVRAPVEGPQEVLVELQRGLDIRDTYTYLEPNGTVEVYYERNVCGRAAASDIYKVKDVALATLTVQLEGTGSGTVTSSPAGINCGADCSGDFERGTTVTLTAGSAPGSVFAAWDGACTGSGSCQITMDSAKEVTATFLPLGSVTIIKETPLNDPQVFTFDPDVALGPGFQLDNDPSTPLPNEHLIEDVSPGMYAIREDAVTGWQVTRIQCIGAQYVPNEAQRRVTIDLDPGEAIQCAFENTLLPPP